MALMMMQQVLVHAALPTVPTPTPGQWCSDSTAAKKYAEDNGVPMIAIWGSTSCGYCNAYDSALTDPAFNAWMQSTPYIYIYIKNTQDSFYSWMWGISPGAPQTLDAYPFLMYYWKKNGQVLVEQRRLGRTAGTLAIGSPLAGQTRALAEQYFAAYSSVPLPTDVWDTNDDTRVGTTNVLELTGTATVQGPHSLNMTDTNDWMKLTGSLVNMTNHVWFTDITTNGPVAGLKAEFFIGDSLVPVGVLTNLQGTFRYQATTNAPLVVKIGRMASTNAVVSYKVNYRRDIPVVGRIGFTQLKFGALPQVTYTTAEETVYEGESVTVWLSRVDGKDLDISAMLNWNTNLPSLGPITWGHGVMGEKSLTFIVPEEAGYQDAAKSLKLTIASNAPAATVVGKTILSLKVYDKEYASVSFTNLVTSGEPVLGQWYGYKSPVSGPQGAFADYTNLAARLNIPLIMYWGDEGCPRCSAFVTTNNTPLVQGWIANQKVLFLALKGLVSEDGNTGYNWIRSRLADPNSSYPWLGFYWKKTNGELVTYAQSFIKKIGDVYISKTGQEFIDAMNVWLAGYDNNGVLYTTMGGQFACGNSTTARLEAEPTTTAVEIPFVRTKGFQTPGTNHLVVTYPGATPAPIAPMGVVAYSIPVSTVQTNMFLWAPGDTNKTFVLAGVNAHYIADQKVELLLLDNELKPVDTNAITYVAAVPNGALNPFFDKTPAVGQWTMDLAKATNATAQTVGEAYTMVMFSGGYWCPWCIGMEETIFAKPEFTTFVQAHNVRMVMLDNPRRDGTAPTFLRHDVDWTRTKFSGSSYLSRNGITAAQGAAKLIANSNQQYNAGWLLPDTTRIGYPTVLLLRKDGTVAGRIGMANNGTTVTNVITGVRSYPYDIAPAMLRLNEALTLASDEKEENNGHRSWTGEALSKDGTDSAQLSASDKNDVYRLTGAGAGMRQVIQISGAQAATVTLSIQNAAGATLAGPVSGNLLPGFALTNAVPATNTFLVVNASGTEFAGTNTSSTIRGYTLTSSIILIATEAANSLMVSAANLIPVEIQLGVVYRFAGTYQCNPADFEDLGNNLWRAKKNGVSTLSFIGVVGEALFTYRIWNPGVVGFTVTTTNITESVGTFTFKVERTNGSAGEVDALVSLGAGTTAEAYRHAFPAGGINLHWADGQVGTTSVTFTVVNDIVFDGTQILQLALGIVGLEPKASLAVSKELMNISIIENDAPVVGQLQFVPAAGQYFAKTMTIVAVEGSTIPLAIERITGAATAVSATITASAGTLSENTLAWVNKDLVPTKQVTLTVPALAVTKTVTVTFAPTGITAVYGKSRLTILVVAAKPAFATATAAFTLTTSVSLRETIKLETQGAGRLTLSRLSGSLPSGIRVTYDAANQEMVLSGTPTRVGSYSAVYQASELVGFTLVKGGTIRLDFQVRSLATINPAAVAKSYSFANYAVVDPATNKVTGLFNLTIGTTGRLTAKYVHAIGYGVSFSATGWSAIAEDGTLTAVMQSSGYVLTVQMNVAGEVVALLTETATDTDLLITLVPTPWSASTPATLYQGYYTVALSANTEEDGAVGIGDQTHMPLGHSYMTLSMSAYAVSSGSMTYAGKLANGVSFSGSAVLLPYTGAQPSGVVHTYAQLGFFKKTGKEIIAGQLAIQANAKNTYKDYPRVVYGGDKAEVADVWWTHTELVPELSYQWKYGVYGGYYSSADDLAAFYEEYNTTYGDAPMVLSFGSALLPASTLYGALTLYPSAYPLNITASAISLTAPVADGTSTSLSFTKATGLFSGTFRMNFATRAGVSGRYAGVLLPAWTDCGCGGEPIKEMPFGLGASWFTDQAFISGATRYPVRGCPVEIYPRDL
jgi:hypothetical protein